MDVARSEALPASQASSSYRWVVLFVGMLCQTGISIPAQGIPTLDYFFQRDMSLTRAQVGLFSTAISVGATLSLLASGWLADRIGVRRLLLAGQVTIGIFIISMGLSSTFSVALLVLIPVGLGSGMINPAITKAMMYWFEPRRRGTVMSIKQSGVPIGGAIAAATLPSVALAFGWHVGVIALGVAISCFGVVSFLLYREYPEPAKRGSASRGLGFRQVIQLITRRDILIASVLAVPLTAIQFSIVIYLLLYLKEIVLFPVVIAGLILSLTQVSSVAGRIFWGMSSDYFFGGSRRRTMLVILAISTVTIAAISRLPVGAPIWLVALLAIALGATAISWNGIYMVLIGEMAGKELAGTAVGFSLTVLQFGIMGGPPFFGFVVDHTGSYRIAWSIMAAFSALAAALLLTVREQRRSQ